MRLADQIAQCQTPLVIQDTSDGSFKRLSGAADFSQEIRQCPTRYVLSDDLTRLCTALAYSKGARTLACADILRVPAQRVWVEWCQRPWTEQLSQYGFKQGADPVQRAGRRGALISSSSTGRQGHLRTFFSCGAAGQEVMTSSMEAHFDFDTPQGEEWPLPKDGCLESLRVFDDADGLDLLSQCFRFRFDRSWSDYYSNSKISKPQTDAIARHALGTIAIDIPVLAAFFLLLTTRPTLPRRPLMLDRLNRLRARAGKAQLVDQTEVFSPLLPEYPNATGSAPRGTRRPSRLHQVRGHLVRRGSRLFWRVPHVRGNARAGIIRARTVTWTVDRGEVK